MSFEEDFLFTHTSKNDSFTNVLKVIKYLKEGKKKIKKEDHRIKYGMKEMEKNRKKNKMN